MFRYVFSSEFQDQLQRFSEEHGHHERKMFQEQWKLWKEMHTIHMSNEYSRLQGQAYTENRISFETKCYTSVRYYHRKKGSRRIVSDVQTVRTKHPKITAVIRQLMKQHIEDSHQELSSPSDKYNAFLRTHFGVKRLEPLRGSERFLDSLSRIPEGNPTTNVSNSMCATEPLLHSWKTCYKNLYYKKREPRFPEKPSSSQNELDVSL